MFVRLSAALPLLLLGFTGCAGTGLGLGTLGDILSPGGVYGARDISGEIRRIDTRRQEIELGTGWWGGAERVRYDGRTDVIYRQRRYDVRSLERGDVVRVRVDADRRGQPYATLIEVQQSVRDRDGGGVWGNARIERLDGSVGRIDSRGGWFELHPQRGRAVIVTLPYEPSRNMRDRFRRLRRGDRVRVEVEPVNGSTVLLYRFL